MTETNALQFIENDEVQGQVDEAQYVELREDDGVITITVPD